MNILVTTMGTTWAVVPELLGFTNPELVNLYAHHPGFDRFVALRAEYRMARVHEVWVVTTASESVRPAIRSLYAWHARHPSAPVLRVWQSLTARDLSSLGECHAMTELILRAVLHARHSAARLYLSLAGGRKTMSADMQHAASLFGCQAMLHAIDSGPLPKLLRDPRPAAFDRPLPPGRASCITPVILGSYPGNGIVDVDHEGKGAILPERFPLPDPEDPGRPAGVSLDNDLLYEIQERLRSSEYLLFNHAHRLRRGASTNFLGLYYLSPSLLERLRSERVGVDAGRGADEIRFLRRLPKAELHCHLGGVADPAGIIEIARANREAAGPRDTGLPASISRWKALVERGDLGALRIRLEKEFGRARPLRRLPKSAAPAPEPFAATAFALLFEGRPALLRRFLFGARGEMPGIGIEAYEGLGDLQGSALLQTEPAILAACRIAAEEAILNNVRYLELRCSPLNYTRGGLTAPQAVGAIRRGLAAYRGRLEISLIFIASRRNEPAEIAENVRLALDDPPGAWPPLAGFDLAGPEHVRPPEELREAFLPLMERCLHLTIHAGEGERAESIWQAVYHLSAERIGHGLTLVDHPELLERFADRRIAVEMCPSSNFQIVGFRDTFLSRTCSLPVYPLKHYLDRGLRVTVNTDNPGISRTDAARELHRAARLTPGGLSLWNILLLVRNGFRAAFAARELRQRLLLDAEKEIASLLARDPEPFSGTRVPAP